MKAEGGMRKVEGKNMLVQSGPFTMDAKIGCGMQIRQPRAVSRPFPIPRGLSLLEVLASIGVLSIGILGLAALLPIGRFTLLQATKADRAGDCGRAGLRDVVVRRMLDPNNWTVGAGSMQAIAIDPLGMTSPNPPGKAPAKLGGFTPRTSLKNCNTFALAQQAFVWPDDLIVTMPEDEKPAQPAGRSKIQLGNKGDYSWFATVVGDDPTHFVVSIVVCYKRDVTAEKAVAIPVAQFYDKSADGTALGGGSVKLSAPISDAVGAANGIAVKENDWVALCNNKGLCRWYRVASIGDDSSLLTLVGPDWTPTAGDQLVALGQSVIGVYTQSVELDTDPTWTN